MEIESTVSFITMMVMITAFGGKAKLKEWDEDTYIYVDREHKIRFAGCISPEDFESLKQRNDWIVF